MKNESKYENKRISYPTIFKELTIEYRKSGHSLEETSKAFKVSTSVVEEWKKKALNRQHEKIAPEKLKACVERHTDAYQREMAEEFDCSVTAIQKSIEALRDYPKKKTTNCKGQNPEKLKLYQAQIKKDTFGKYCVY